MRWHIKTRSRSRDYSFVGDEPERWWSRFGVDTAFERPTLLVEGTVEGWRVLASGIPSSRRDSHHTQLGYTIVGHGEPGDEPGPALRLIAAWLDDAASLFSDPPPPSSELQLSPLLETELSEELIESWFAAAPTTDELAEEVHQRITRCLGLLGDPKPDQSEREAGWWAAIQCPAARYAFQAHAVKLIEGKTRGGAYLLNLADRPDQVTSLGVRQRAALLFDLPHQADQGPTPFRPLPGPTRRPAPPREKKKSPPPGPPPGPPAGPSPGSRPGSRPGSQPPGLSSSRRPSPPAPVAARRRVVVDASGTERSSVDAGPVTFEYVQRLVKLTRRGLSLREAVEKLREVGGEVPLSVGEAIDMLRELGSDAPHSVREAIDMLRDLGSDAPHSVKELVDILRRGIAAGGGRRSSPSSQPPPAVDDDDRGKAALAAAVPTAIVLRRPLPWLRPLRTLCLRPTRLFRRTAGARRATRRMRPSLGRLRGRARRRRPGPRR